MKEYIYDNSFDGLLTAIFYAYSEKDAVRITKDMNDLPNLFYEKVTVITEQDKAERVYTSLNSKLSYETLSNVYYLYLYNDPAVDTLILSYVKLCFKCSSTINLAKNNDIIRTVDKYVRRVYGEAHRFHGFVRFKEVAPSVFYAQIEPDHDILPLIVSHFKERFSDQYFIIHDLRREYAIIYDLKEAYFKDFSIEEGKKIVLSSQTDCFESLFKSFYQAVTIEERKNERQRRSFMPKRYWKHLIEVK